MFHLDPNKGKKDFIIKALFIVGYVLVLTLPLVVLAQSSTDVSVLKFDIPELGPGNITEVVKSIIRLLLLGAMVAAIAWLIFAGYKYITSGGNPEAMTQAKNQILGVVIGLIVILSSYALVTLVNKIVSGRLTEISFQLYQPQTQTSTNHRESGTPPSSQTEESATTPTTDNQENGATGSEATSDEPVVGEDTTTPNTGNAPPEEDIEESGTTVDFGDESSPRTTPPEESPATPSPYKQCLQEAKNKYEECKNATEQICLAQKRAYELCLKGLGWIFRSFCDSRRRDYYNCRNNWLRNCSAQYRNDREYCYLQYHPY